MTKTNNNDYSGRPVLDIGDPRTGYITVDQIFHGMFDEMLMDVLEKKHLTAKNFFLQGARFSGKTRNVLHFIMKTFLATAGKGQIIFYIVRKKEKQLNKMKKQMFEDFFSEFNFKVEQGKNFKGGDINQLKFKDNYICFETLNSDKIKLEDGGAVGGTTWSKADYIFLFFEECSQLKQGLVDQLADTTRGNKHTQKVTFFASNPWHKMHWFTQIMLKYLPEDRSEMEEHGYQFRQCEYRDKEQAVFVRNNLLTNPHVPLQQVQKIESYKDYNINAYNICYLGLCGVLEATLYSASLQCMRQIDQERINVRGLGKWQVGIDWGEGKSAYASPTTMHLIQVHATYGAQVIKEYTHWNNGNGGDLVPTQLSTVQQFDKMIGTLLEWQKFLNGQPITCFIDTGATTDFAQMLNDRMQSKYNISEYEMKCYPADKSVPIEERVLTTNMLISKGLLRVCPVGCPDLITALASCRQLESETPTEEGRFQRDHKFSHWLNSGVEYGLGEYQYILSKGFSEIYETRKD